MSGEILYSNIRSKWKAIEKFCNVQLYEEKYFLTLSNLVEWGKGHMAGH